MCHGCGLEGVSGRHLAPCGVVCAIGSALGDGYTHDEPHHSPPCNLSPETDGHYHGECPAGCFKDCCKPPGNLCGPKCLQCFGCDECGYIHAAEEPHRDGMTGERWFSPPKGVE